jgi:hypothetical protein
MSSTRAPNTNIPLSMQSDVKKLVATGKSKGEALQMLGNTDHILAKQWRGTKRNLAIFRKGARTTAKKAIEEKYAPHGMGYHAAKKSFDEHAALQKAAKSGGQKRQSRKHKTRKHKTRKHTTRKHKTRKHKTRK